MTPHSPRAMTIWYCVSQVRGSRSSRSSASRRAAPAAGSRRLRRSLAAKRRLADFEFISSSTRSGVDAGGTIHRHYRRVRAAGQRFELATAPSLSTPIRGEYILSTSGPFQYISCNSTWLYSVREPQASGTCAKVGSSMLLTGSDQDHTSLQRVAGKAWNRLQIYHGLGFIRPS